eukprot:s5778_g1.t1
MPVPAEVPPLPAPVEAPPLGVPLPIQPPLPPPSTAAPTYSWTPTPAPRVGAVYSAPSGQSYRVREELGLLSEAEKEAWRIALNQARQGPPAKRVRFGDSEVREFSAPSAPSEGEVEVPQINAEANDHLSDYEPSLPSEDEGEDDLMGVAETSKDDRPAIRLLEELWACGCVRYVPTPLTACTSGSGVVDGGICIAHCSRGYELDGVASVLTCNSGSLSGMLPVHSASLHVQRARCGWAAAQLQQYNDWGFLQCWLHPGGLRVRLRWRRTVSMRKHWRVCRNAADTCGVSCAKGWTLVGWGSQYECQSDGNITGVLPDCVGNPCENSIPADQAFSGEECDGMTTGLRGKRPSPAKVSRDSRRRHKFISASLELPSTTRVAGVIQALVLGETGVLSEDISACLRQGSAKGRRRDVLPLPLLLEWPADVDLMGITTADALHFAKFCIVSLNVLWSDFKTSRLCRAALGKPTAPQLEAQKHMAAKTARMLSRFSSASGVLGMAGFFPEV